MIDACLDAAKSGRPGYNLNPWLCMCNLDRCRNGTQDCQFDDAHELALAGELMHIIGDYSKTQDIDPCPLCLRDTMLAIAALLQLEAARIDSPGTARLAANVKHLGNTLAKAVREQLAGVILAKAAIVSRSKN